MKTLNEKDLPRRYKKYGHFNKTLSLPATLLFSDSHLCSLVFALFEALFLTCL